MAGRFEYVEPTAPISLCAAAPVCYGPPLANIDQELTRVFDKLRSQHDMLPFMDRLLSTGDMTMSRMPSDMRAILEESPDYRHLEAGCPPCWVQIAAGNDCVEIVVYRAEADGFLYLVAPSDKADVKGHPLAS